jgi:trehalose/maltose hydrolase-like predicted phosphorylase
LAQVLAAHEAAWDARWAASGIVIEGDDDMRQALRFAVYHLTSACQSRGRARIDGRALSHRRRLSR